MAEISALYLDDVCACPCAVVRVECWRALVRILNVCSMIVILVLNQ